MSSRKKVSLFQIYGALVTDLSHDKNHLVGHNDFYEQILLPKDLELLGKTVLVEIVGTTKFSMIGKVVSGSVIRPTEFEPLKSGQVSGAMIASNESSYEHEPPDARNTTLHILEWSLLFCLLALAFRIVERYL